MHVRRFADLRRVGGNSTPGVESTGRCGAGTLHMRFSHYFAQARSRQDRRSISIEWILRVAHDPEHQAIQSDGRHRRWGRIREAGGRWLRVVLLADGETIHNAFFDRSFRPPLRLTEPP